MADHTHPGLWPRPRACLETFRPAPALDWLPGRRHPLLALALGPPLHRCPNRTAPRGCCCLPGRAAAHRPRRQYRQRRTPRAARVPALPAGRGLDVPAEVFRIHPFPQPQPLPRYLTDDEVARLQEAHEAALREAHTSNARRNALLDRACFYLLWHGGLRPGEIGDLLLEDLDLPGKRLRIRLGKGSKDRTVYLTTAAVEALRDYLAARGDGPSHHVFLYRHRPLAKDLVRDRLKAKGDALGIHAYPYRLRHTCATQLLNAGARLETIQYLLGHEYLRTTQVYARVHDATVAGDYYRAMVVVEERVALEGATSTDSFSLWPRLLALAEQVQVNSDPVGQSRRIAELRQLIATAAEGAGAVVQRDTGGPAWALPGQQACQANDSYRHAPLPYDMRGDQ